MIVTKLDLVESDADISDCERYRFRPLPRYQRLPP